MTFTEIVADVASRMNLTSADALARIGTHVNNRYKRVTTSIGMTDFRRVTFDFEVAPTERVQTIPDVERVISVSRYVGTVRQRPPLIELSYDELLTAIPTTDIRPTSNYAVKRLGAAYVQLQFTSTFDDGAILFIEAEEIARTLAGSQEPQFSMSYHDILVFGAMADECRKMEKLILMKSNEDDYERVMGELRLHIAAKGYKDIIQGKYNSAFGPFAYRRACVGPITS